MREIFTALATALLPLAFLALAVLVAQGARALGRYIRDRRYAMAVELVALGAAGVVADLMQDVAGLKDPSKPGAWNDATAAAMKLRAITRLRELYPGAAAVILAVVRDPAKVDDLFAGFVERAVIDAKAGASKPSAVRAATPPYNPQSGRASVGPMLLAVAIVAALACSAARSRLADADPTMPGRASCVAGSWRCNGRVPEHCDTDEDGSAVTRWYPAHGLGADRRPAPCAVACVVDGTAHCAAEVTP